MTTPPNWPHAAHADITEFSRIYPDVQKLEALANKHGIYDIFQDNNGKLLQVVLLLNLKIVDNRASTTPTPLLTVPTAAAAQAALQQAVSQDDDA